VDLSAVYFIELELAAADGKAISRNVYWLATQTDELDWANSNWYLTPVTRYADLTALQAMPTVPSEVRRRCAARAVSRSSRSP
jgi:exo-1,4-beta-D-glucosaminidase